MRMRRAAGGVSVWFVSALVKTFYCFGRLVLMSRFSLMLAWAMLISNHESNNNGGKADGGRREVLDRKP